MIRPASSWRMAIVAALAILLVAAPAIAGNGIRIGQATPFATLAPDVKFPEGIAADAHGRIYVSTFSFAESFIVKLGHGGHELQRTGNLGVPLLGLAFNADGDLFAADFGNGKILKIADGDLSNTPEDYATLPCCAYLPGFPPFGANGLALRGDALYVANTRNDTILRLPLSGGTPIPVEVWAQSINGADGIAFDHSGRLWVCANQEDELVVLKEIDTTTANGDPVKVGKVLFKVGDFEGIVGNPGSQRPKGFLFPASLVIVGHKVFVTNLALGLTDANGDEPEEQVDLFTVVKVEGIPGL